MIGELGVEDLALAQSDRDRHRDDHLLVATVRRRRPGLVDLIGPLPSHHLAARRVG